MTEPVPPGDPRTRSFETEDHPTEHHRVGDQTREVPAYGGAPPYGFAGSDPRGRSGDGTEITGAADGLRVSNGRGSATITPEAIVYVLAVAAVFITSAIIDEDGPGPGFSASRAFFYVTLLTMAYILSRGLSRIGSRSDDRSPRI